jgi:organic hydroperoxide reductase OsmC/OhrA
VPSGPLSARVRVRLVAEGADDATLQELAQWGVEHCPVCNALERAVPIIVEVATN